MIRNNLIRALIGSIIAGTALFVSWTPPASAGDHQPTLSATTVFATDYIFRGISNSDENPAAQPEIDLLYGIFYAGIWGSNSDFGDGIEIDYYVGMTPNWGPVTFDFAVLGYTFPGGNDIDFLELKTGARWTTGSWSFGVTNYWSPDYVQAFGNSDAIEGSVSYAFNSKVFNFFMPSVSGLIGFQSYDEIASDYTYWNAGLTLGFMEHYSVDVRYWDTNYSDAECLVNSGGRSNCDARVVGTLKAVF